MILAYTCHTILHNSLYVCLCAWRHPWYGQRRHWMYYETLGIWLIRFAGWSRVPVLPKTSRQNGSLHAGCLAVAGHARTWLVTGVFRSHRRPYIPTVHGFFAGRDPGPCTYSGLKITRLLIKFGYNFSSTCTALPTVLVVNLFHYLSLFSYVLPPVSQISTVAPRR